MAKIFLCFIAIQYLKPTNMYSNDCQLKTTYYYKLGMYELRFTTVWDIK